MTIDGSIDPNSISTDRGLAQTLESLASEIGGVRALVVRQAADYGRAGVSHRIAQRQVRRAALFVTAVQEVLNA